jgi:hypothetical protein
MECRLARQTEVLGENLPQRPLLSITKSHMTRPGFFCKAIVTAATPGLLCQPRVMVKMIVEKQMECRFGRGYREVLGENLPQRPLLSITKSYMIRPGFEPGPPRWEAGDQPLELWRGPLGFKLLQRRL